jgi:1-phosphofructokinase family hexose kinase
MIVTLTLHPAIDRTLWLASRLQPYTLHRTVQVEERAGGKGINVASVLKELGEEVLAVTVRAGLNGERLARLLERQRLPHRLLEVAGETRECQTLVHGPHHPTDIYESGPALNKTRLEQLRNLLPPLDTLVISGSLPPGLSPTDFAAWLQTLKPLGKMVVDSSGAALMAALKAGVDLVKPNQDELEEVGLRAWQIWEDYGVRVLLSKGADGLEYFGPEGNHHQGAAQIQAVNPVGAGDACLAGFVQAEHRGKPIAECLRLAAACGAAAAEELVAGKVQGSRVQELLTQLSMPEGAI